MSDGLVLVSERLEYWRPAASDLAAIFAIVSDPETERFIGHRESMADQFQRSMRNGGSWQLYGYGSFTLRLRGTQEIVGTTGVFHSWRGLGEDVDDQPEVGWILRRDQVGRGLGYESARTSLDWFDMAHGPRAVTCFVSVENAPSLALAARLGFEPVRETVFPDGALVRLLVRPPRGGPKDA